uniref:Integrase catalytic domain-containing protein n=1 Tax=Fagus sylvatica TaxID=28930 RepID=A0A2N9GDK8_FAGSY
MAGETSGPGPSEQEIRMVALERKFDELLSFVQLIAKRNPDDENQRKEDDKGYQQGGARRDIPNTNATPPRPPTPPKPEGERLPFKAPEFEKYNGRGDPMIHLQMYCRKMAPYADNEPLLIQTFQDTLTGNAAEWYSQLKKISHWKELADTFLAQYGFNSQIAPDRFDLQRMEKKSNETFREYAQRWREKGGSSTPATRRKRDDQDLRERIEDALKTKKIVDMTALMALAEQAAKKAPTKKKEGDADSDASSSSSSDSGPWSPRCRQDQWETKPMTIGWPYNGPQRRDFDQNSTCDFHFGEVGHTVNNCQQLRHRVQDLIDHGILKFEGLPNITTNPLPNHPEGGVNMVEIEERGEERIAWRRLFYTLEKQRHITPLEAPPGPSTGDACEYHSGARGHSLECCEEVQEESHRSDGERASGERRKYHRKRSHQPDDPSDFDWYAELNLDDICHLGFETPEFEIFYENGDPEDPFAKVRREDGLTLWRTSFLMISVFPESLSKQAAAWFYQLRNLTGWDDLARVFLEVIPLQSPFDSGISGEKKKRKPSRCHQPKTQTTPPLPVEGEEPIKTPPVKSPSNTTTAEEEYAGPMVGGLSIHTITEEEDSTTTPPTRRCQQGEEAKMWTCVPLLQRVSSSNEITRKTSNDPHVSKIDNKTNCSLDNIDNSDEEIELPNDILEALERQDEGSKPNIEELETVNLANEGEEPREVKIGTRCATEQKEALIALLREFHEIFAWSYQDMPGLDTDIVIKEEVEKQLKAGFLSTVTYSDWVANIVPVPKKDGKVRMCVDYRDLNRASPKDNFPLPHIDTLVDNTATNAVFSFMDGFSGTQEPLISEPWSPLFHDMIHHEIEVYVDDMIAKSRTAQDHLTDLRKLFQRLKKYQLRLNPNKCAFGVTSGKLLGFIVSGRGIEIDPAKVQAIRSMPAPKTEKEIRSFLGRINYIARFIAQLTATCEPLFKLLRKDDVPSSYTSQSKKHPWAACWDNKTRLGRKEQAIYYLSKKFTEPETRYLLVEKTCCALAWASKKLRQYMLYYTTWLVSRMDPIKYIFEKPALTGKIARWQNSQTKDVMTVDEDNHGRWKLYFDGAANAVGSGIGAVLVSPKGQQTPIAVKLGFDCTNNMTEYEACIVVSQTNGEWQARDPKLIPYQRYISRLVPKFKYITFTYTPRAHNHFADALATLASLIKLVEGDDVRPLRNRDSRHPGILEYPPRATENEKKYIRRMAFQFFLSGEILYKRTHDATLLRCVDAEEANRLIQEMHAGLMGAHANGPFLARKIHESWLLLVDNGEGLHQTCPDVPQMPDVSEQQERTSPSIFHTMASPWPFSAWGMDVIGAITPKASNGHEFILVAIDYFTKWVEACSFKNVTQVAVTRFVKNNIICRYGMPEMLITDNASNLNNRMMDQLCQQFKIQHHNSAPYRPKMNGACRSRQQKLRTSVGATPYSLVYGMEAVLPVEVEIPSLRILSQTQLEEAEVGPSTSLQQEGSTRTFQPGDLVLKKRNMALSDPRGKFAPSYEGPYVVKKAFSGGAIILADMDGEEFRSPINSDSVIKYHV